MATKGLSKLVWFRTTDIPKLQVKYENAVRTAARKIRTKAIAIADEPSSPYVVRPSSGKLRNSIGVRNWSKSAKGVTTRIEVSVDLAKTQVKGGGSYALFQEQGTGWYGRYHRKIKMPEGKFMSWVQKGRPYRAKSGALWSKLLTTTSRTVGKGRWKKTVIDKTYQMYAKEVKGVKAKHFWRIATTDKTIKDELKEELKKLTAQAFAIRAKAQEVKI